MFSRFDLNSEEVSWTKRKRGGCGVVVPHSHCVQLVKQNNNVKQTVKGQL